MILGHGIAAENVDLFAYRHGHGSQAADSIRQRVDLPAFAGGQVTGIGVGGDIAPGLAGVQTGEGIGHHPPVQLDPGDGVIGHGFRQVRPDFGLVLRRRGRAG